MTAIDSGILLSWISTLTYEMTFLNKIWTKFIQLMLAAAQQKQLVRLHFTYVVEFIDDLLALLLVLG